METTPLSMHDECSMELRKGGARAKTLVNVNSRCKVSVMRDCKKIRYQAFEGDCTSTESH